MTLNLSHLGIKHTKKKVEQEVTEAILLNRVSSKEQAEGYSLEAQEERLRSYCSTKNLDVVQVCSFAESSTRGNRPKFRDMMKQIKARKKPRLTNLFVNVKLKKYLKMFFIADSQKDLMNTMSIVTLK